MTKRKTNKAWERSEFPFPVELQFPIDNLQNYVRVKEDRKTDRNSVANCYRSISMTFSIVEHWNCPVRTKPPIAFRSCAIFRVLALTR